MKPIFDTCPPRAEVLSGDLKDEMFAARPRDVMEGSADPVYRDAKAFFEKTYPTEGMKTLVREVLGRLSCKAFLNKAGLLDDGTFKACLQALVNAIPRTKQKGKFLRPEATALENLYLAFYAEITLPAEEAPPEVEPQGMLPGMSGEEEMEEMELEEEDADEGDED